MSEAVKRLAGNEAEWQAAHQRCLAFIARHYSEDAVLRPYLEAFSRNGKNR